MNKWDAMDYTMAGTLLFIVLLVIGAVYSVYEKSNFDYSECIITEEVRSRYTAAWTQTQVVGKITTTIYHPARSWTERRFMCPDNDGYRKPIWREIND